MHTIDLGKYSIHTDLIIENKIKKDYTTKEEIVDDIIVERTSDKEDKNHYTTISFKDIKDKDNFKKVEKILIKELNKGDTGVLKDVIIEGLTFKYPFGNRGILLWKSDEFISLDKAYEKGLIQKDELIKLHQIFNN